MILRYFCKNIHIPSLKQILNFTKEMKLYIFCFFFLMTTIFNIFNRMDWDKLAYNVIPTDYMYIMKSNEDGTFSNGALVPFGTIQIEPHSSVLNYGQVSDSTTFAFAHIHSSCAWMSISCASYFQHLLYVIYIYRSVISVNYL